MAYSWCCVRVHPSSQSSGQTCWCAATIYSSRKWCAVIECADWSTVECMLLSPEAVWEAGWMRSKIGASEQSSTGDNTPQWTVLVVCSVCSVHVVISRAWQIIPFFLPTILKKLAHYSHALYSLFPYTISMLNSKIFIIKVHQYGSIFASMIVHCYYNSNRLA